MPRPRGTSHYRLLDIKITEIARHNLERFQRLRRVATLYLQALHALAELAHAVLSFRDSLGDGEKSDAEWLAVSLSECAEPNGIRYAFSACRYGSQC